MKAIKLYKLAALLLTAAAVWACTVEEYPAQMQNKVTLVTTLSPRGAVSRALSDPGNGTLTSAWAVGEEVWLYYEDSASKTNWTGTSYYYYNEKDEILIDLYVLNDFSQIWIWPSAE